MDNFSPFSRRIHISLKKECDDSYDILIGDDMRDRIARDLSTGKYGDGCVILCDTNTETLFAHPLQDTLREHGISCGVLAVPAGEESKSLEVMEQILEIMREWHVSRKDYLVALGGGVIGDLGGFTAGVYMRGIPFVQIPTTLLSMVDSSVGGKVAVNIENGKNYCGLFHQPKRVYMDLDMLSSLPVAELDSGLAEVLKYALSYDADFYEYLLENVEAVRALDKETMTHIASTCCEIKAAIVEQDEREGGLRMILNYGHTVGHAIESLSNYTLSHGQCVAYGMRAVAQASRDLGRMSGTDFERHNALLDAYGLGTGRLDFKMEDIVELMKSDKKASAGKPVFILPDAIGSVSIVDDTSAESIGRATAAAILRNQG